MSRPIEPAPVDVIVCETCGGGERDAQNRTRGEQLHALLERERDRRGANVRIERVRCLWSCQRACNVHVRASGKFGYVLGDFEPTASDAGALLDYAELHAASEDGSVPFRTWPDGVRGHFQCRIPPAPRANDPAETPAPATPSTPPEAPARTTP